MAGCDFYHYNKMFKNHRLYFTDPWGVLDPALRTNAWHYAMNMGLSISMCMFVFQYSVLFCPYTGWSKCPVLTWTTWSSSEACCPTLPSSCLAWMAPLSQIKHSRPCALWVVTVLLAISVFWLKHVQPNVIKDQFHLHSSAYTGMRYNAELPFRWFWHVLLLLYVRTWQSQPRFN